MAFLRRVTGLRPLTELAAFGECHLSSLASFGNKGSGGRCSVSGIKAAVFGSTGFLGQYVVNALGRIGSRQILPYRCTENNIQHLKVMGDLGTLNFYEYSIRDDAAIQRALAGCNVVINMLGKDYDTANFSFTDVNVEAAARIAKFSVEAGVSRLVHVSALGASPDAISTSLRAKAAGEEAVLAEFPQTTIVRPAPLVGVEDRFLNHFQHVSRKFPALPLYGGGTAKVAPVHVADVALGIKALLLDGDTTGGTYEFAGPKVTTIAEVAAMVQEISNLEPSVVHVPLRLIELLGEPREYLLRRMPMNFPSPFPTWLTSDFARVMCTDRVASGEFPGLPEVGVAPRELDGYVLDYLRVNRAGGLGYVDAS